MDECTMVRYLAKYFSKKGFLTRQEVGAGYGRADLVLAKLNNDKCIIRKKRRQVWPLLKEHYFQVLRLLPDIDHDNSEPINVSDLAVLVSVSKSYLKYRLLKELEENGFVKRVDGEFYYKINGWVPLVEEMVAIEAKLRDWKRGFIQANRYKTFADKSYLAILEKYRHLVDLKLLESHNVGLFVLSEDGKNVTEILSPRKVGNPLAGAVVTITDALGNSDIWQDTMATGTKQLDPTEPDLNVSDGTKFAVGDYIRAEHCQEILKVTDITGDTLTVDHAQNTTKAMTILTGKKLFKRITSLTTDANGDVTPYYLTQMIINPIATDMTGYRAEDLNLLDTHVTLGHVEVWAKTPHTITISKSGYITKTVKLTMDRKREEVETLEPQVNFITLGGQEVIHNADPTDGQNRDRWVKI